MQVVHKDTTLHTITELYTESFSVCPNITSKFRNIALFKSVVKQDNDWSKTCRYVHDLFCTKLHLPKSSGSRVLSIKQDMNVKIQPPSTFLFWFCTVMVYSKMSIQWRILSIHNFMAPHWLVQVLHPPQKYEHPPFWNGVRCRTKRLEVIFNGRPPYWIS
jgi:hypothetical protein